MANLENDLKVGEVLVRQEGINYLKENGWLPNVFYFIILEITNKVIMVKSETGLKYAIPRCDIGKTYLRHPEKLVNINKILYVCKIAINS